MDERIGKIESRLDQVGDTLHSIDKTLVQQAANLKEHMRRTATAEKRQATLEKMVAKELKPIKRHVDGVNYLLKAIGVLTLVLSSAFSALKTYDYIAERSAKGEKKHVPAHEAPRKARN